MIMFFKSLRHGVDKFKFFLASILHGIKLSYAKNRNVLLVLITLFVPFIEVWGIKVFVNHFLQTPDFLWQVLCIIEYILAFVLLANYLHFTEAHQYAKKHSISFEDAWNATKADDEDCF